jgi:hypothetical protein
MTAQAERDPHVDEVGTPTLWPDSEVTLQPHGLRALEKALKPPRTKASRSVTSRRCLACDGRLPKAARADTSYCSARCRMQAHRARLRLDAIDVELAASRRRYWELVREKAMALGVAQSQVVTAQAQLVTESGDVYMGGPVGGLGADAVLVGRTKPHRPGWSAWGSEAAGPPWSTPLGS